MGEEDKKHLFKMVWWSRVLTLLGYATSWVMINPLSILLIGLGNMGRWTTVVHPVMHKGYDKVPNMPKKYTSKYFARGLRRYLDWLDWLHPKAWDHEHNALHHFNTSQKGDPDIVEVNTHFIRHPRVPRIIKKLMIVFVMCTWKLSYYAPNTFFALKYTQKWKEEKQRGQTSLTKLSDVSSHIIPGEKVVLPVTKWGLEFWAKCVLPYALFRFVLVPLLFLPLGVQASVFVLINSILAEVVANVITFVTIAPNHTGDDVYHFEGDGYKSRAEFYIKQCAGSVNYTGGSDLKDFLQGYLNYQIEHHVWPDLPLLKYTEAAPQLKAICQKHGVPYIEESVFARFKKTWDIMMGDTSMLVKG